MFNILKNNHFTKYIFFVFLILGYQAIAIYEYKVCQRFYLNKPSKICRIINDYKLTAPAKYILENANILELFLKNKNTSGLFVIQKQEVAERFDSLKSGFTFYYPRLSRPNAGYLILSGGDPSKNGEPLLELWDLNKQEKLFKWNINGNDILKKINSKNKANSTRFLHPLLLKNGNLIFTLEGNLVMISPDGSFLKTNSELNFHHSIEIDRQGKIYAPFWNKDIMGAYPRYKNRYANSGFAILDSELKLLEKYYLDEIYEDAGLDYDLFNPKPTGDPYHLNDVEPLRDDNKTAVVLLSVRHQSSVLAFNLNDRKIKWILKGYSNFQHDVDFLNKDGTYISIFDNNVEKGSSTKRNFYTTIENLPSPISNEKLYIFNYVSNHAKERELLVKRENFASLNNKFIPKTYSNGRSDFIKDNSSLTIEETIFGRTFEFDPNTKKLLWQYINRNDDNMNYYMNSWSRRIDIIEEKTIENLFKETNNN